MEWADYTRLKLPLQSNQVGKCILISGFKSDPGKTTADNINAFLKKNYQNEIGVPKFTTINHRQIQHEIYAPQNNNIIDSSMNKQLGEEKIEERSDVDSDLDVFV